VALRSVWLSAAISVNSAQSQCGSVMRESAGGQRGFSATSM
jgi:hypothetical protein